MTGWKIVMLNFQSYQPLWICKGSIHPSLAPASRASVKLILTYILFTFVGGM